jgi:predicted ester cyclase
VAAIPEAQGRDGFVRTMTKLREAFPDLSLTVEDVLAEGDRAVLRLTFAGTHRGPLAFARLPLAATGKSVRMEQIHIVRVADGKIVEHWMAQDALAMFRQLGLQITPAGAA